MRIGLILLCLLWIAGASMAQEVQVRSGEHSDFSRLTMELPKRADWTVEKTTDGARVVFTKPPFKLDTSEIFRRIPRDRIEAVRWNQSENALELSFSCACNVAMFWHDRTMLVVDVRDGSDLAEEATETTQVSSETDGADPSNPEPFDGLRPLTSTSLIEEAFPTLNSEAVADPDEILPVSSLSPEVRDRLLRQIGRAASQGLLTPNLTRPDRADEEDRGADEIQTPNIQVTDGTENADRINLTAHSSIDRAFMGGPMEEHRRQMSSGCIPDDRIDVASWGHDDDYASQISTLRRDLIGEFDKPDQNTALLLARLYLFFGFGAEAKVVLGLLPEDNEEKHLLLILAAIAENGHSAEAPLSASQLDCETSAALWAALSYAKLPRGTPIDTDSVLRSFGALPVHLRKYYGPDLAERFLRIGQTDVSSKLLRIIDRNKDAKSPESELATADLLVDLDEPSKADQALQDVIESNSEPSAEAIVKMVDQRFRSDREISYELAQLAGAYAYENRDEDIGLALQQAFIRSLVASGAVDQAFTEFSALVPRLGKVERAELLTDLLQRITDTSDDVTFLQYVLWHAGEASRDIRPQTQHTIAERFLLLGFPERAENYLSEDLPPGHFAERDRQLLRARVSLAQGLPRRAVVDLLGLDGPNVSMLRAKAHDMVGEHKAASHLYVAADEIDQAQRQAWLASDWDVAAARGEVYENLAALLGRSPEIPLDAQAPVEVLAENRRLLEDSQDMRRTLDALLASNRLDHNASP